MLRLRCRFLRHRLWAYAIPVVIAAAGIGSRVHQWYFSRTLWLDEEMIFLNIRDRMFSELVGPLWLYQTAPARMACAAATGSSVGWPIRQSGPCAVGLVCHSDAGVRRVDRHPVDETDWRHAAARVLWCRPVDDLLRSRSETLRRRWLLGAHAARFGCVGNRGRQGRSARSRVARWSGG